jgi:hypothetical protein
MPLSQRRKHLNTVAGLALLAGLAYAFWPFVMGRGEMQDFCRTLQPGLSLSQVEASASARGYTVTAPIKSRAFVLSQRSFGRFNCELRFGASGLESVEYVDNN